MTQILTGRRRFGTIPLMTKMMKLELAPEKANAEEVDLDEYYDQELEEPAVKTVAQGVRLAEQLKDFAQYYGHEELSFTLRSQSKVNDILHELKLRGLKYQKTITGFFS